MRFGGDDLLRLDERGFRRLRGKRIAMVLQDPKYSLDPVMTVGQQIAETHRCHFRSSAQGRARRRAGDARGRPHPRSRARLRALSAPGLRRHGPARHDRHDADRRPRPPDRRRADLGARRDGAAPGAGDHGRSGAPPRHGADPHQPQSASGLVVLRPRAGDVRRPHRRDLHRPELPRRATPTRAACSPRCPNSDSAAPSCRSCSAIAAWAEDGP